LQRDRVRTESHTASCPAHAAMLVDAQAGPVVAVEVNGSPCRGYASRWIKCYLPLATVCTRKARLVTTQLLK
jgi:hypothetical protein